YADAVFAKEKEVNELQMDVDDRAIKPTALQQPVGTDVRFLFMASRIAAELERIADQAVNITQNAHHYLQAPPLKPLVDLPSASSCRRRCRRGTLPGVQSADS
ncbi:MAG: phosphate transport system regulatory protein PhoU, partial [Planctomycetes bacterium]|nr:phosphate transport system regulatory protein PhoU [Planctomycetota bacterium]